MFRNLKQHDGGDGENPEYHRPEPYKAHGGEKSAFKLLSKVFSSKHKQKRAKRFRSPFVERMQPLSGQGLRENQLIEDDREEIIYQSDLEDCEIASRSNSQYNVVFIEGPVNTLNNPYGEENTYAERNKVRKIQGKEHRPAISQNEPYFEVVNVVDRGTDPCDLIPEKPAVSDKGTDPPYPRECDVPSCVKERAKLSGDLNVKEKLVKNSLEEGNLLLEDLEKIKRHLSSSGKIPEAINMFLSVKQENPADFLHLSRKCLMEMGKHMLAAQKQAAYDMQKLKNELNAVKKEKSEKEERFCNLKRKLDVKNEKVNLEEEDTVNLQSKIGKLHDALEAGRKIFKETEKSFKNQIEKLEAELSTEKESNAKLHQTLEEKSCVINRQDDDIKQLQNSLECSKQQIRETHTSYKSKIAKLELDHTNKMSALCENQTLTNEQLSKALERSSIFVEQLQESKKLNTTLADENKALEVRMAALEREVNKAREQCVIAERRLSRETQEVMALKNQLDRLETINEEELLSVDGDIWCQIMYQHDQWILEDLRASLQDKEKHLESLRSQGDCALRDFEKVQSELQQRRRQFNELKDVFLDFEKKRDIVVREQRDFYNKMMLLSKKTIPRDRFFKNLIEECQLKSSRIGELESILKDTNQAIEETKKISEAQLKAMQAEMKFTAEKLYEFENQIRIKEMQLQEVIKIFEQEKTNKATAEEAMNTYKILLEDTKKENSELRSKLNYLEDLEKNRSNVKAAEDLAEETRKRKDTERKLKKIEKEMVDMKNILQGKGGSTTPHSDKSGLSSRDTAEHLQGKIQELLENKKYMERILMESQRSKEQLQKDHEELYNKMRHAVRVMVESKKNQEELERRLDHRGHTIQKLQRSQVETEDRLEELRDILHEMKKTIELLYEDREQLQDKLTNHTHCNAERAAYQELKSIQRDRDVMEDQNSREKEMLLHRIQDNESIIKEQLRHLRGLQDQVDDLKSQLRETNSALVTERHKHTQQLLSLQSEKKKQEMYIQELETRKAIDTRLRLKAGSDFVDSSPNYVNTSDSYDLPIRDYNRYPHRK